MSCDGHEERWIELYYGEMEKAEALSLQLHLTECDACRQRWQALGENAECLTRAAHAGELDLAPLDPLRLFGAVRLRERRRADRWRRLAGMSLAAAALVAVASWAARKVDVYETHLVVRWGQSPPRESAPSPAPPASPVADATVQELRAELAAARQALREHRRRLDDAERLAALIVTELQDDDARLDRAVASLHLRIDDVRRTNDDRWQAVGRGFHDWYLTRRVEPSPLAQQTPFTPLEQGTSP